MEQLETRERIAREFDTYYSTFDPYTETLLEMLEHMYEAHKGEPSCLLKARMIRILCENCPVHLFRESPFFFEISSGRPRHSWGGLSSPVGTFLHTKTRDLWLQPYAEELKVDREQGFMHGWDNPVGIDHFCLGYDTILKEGIEGILKRAEDALTEAEGAQERSFLEAAIESGRALIGLAGRFEAEARRLANAAADEAARRHYLRIADAASRVPAKPARTFYEALCTILFCRECISSVEGLGISTFGQLDRMLAPYYEADVSAGRMTTEEAKMLFHTLLIYTDVRFEAHSSFHETSTTIIIGGCDQEGRVVYNDVTRQLLLAVLEGRYVNTKVNCRVSLGHPKEYFARLAEIQAANIPLLVMQNDDVLIPARVKCGQELEDARLYVSGGCHEIVLANTEVNTRADTWINLPRILLASMERGATDGWEAFYDRALADVRAYIERIVAIKNRYEAFWSECDPLPLCSATITGCIERRKDLTAGGAKYSSTALSMVGAATMIDSLYAVKHLIWDTGKLTYEALCQAVRTDFADQEPLRQYILRKIPKYGTNHPELNAFAAKVLEDLSKMAGQKNARGGAYLPAFYPHDLFRLLGELTGATPDGRRSGIPLSRGCAPSEFIEGQSPLDIISSLGSIDFTNYADSFCAEITLPRMVPDVAANVFQAIMQAFLEQGGSSLQFNMLDREMLLDAQQHPEQHANIVVRVCGYSAVFIYLNKQQQDEVIQRAIR